MTTTDQTPPAPSAAYLAEQAGYALGRAYSTVTGAAAGQVRRIPRTTVHWRLAHRAGSAVRRGTGRGVDHLERRARTAPRRLVAGLARLFRSAAGPSLRAAAARTGTTGFLGWWGWSWAEHAGLPLHQVAAGAAGAALVAAYAAGKEPEERPVTRRDRVLQRRAEAAQHAAVRDLLGALHTLLQDAPGLHLADLADQITARSTALGTPVKASVASLRALLEPLGVPIRDQLALPDNRNRPGIHAGDWQVWAARHGAPLTHPTSPAPPREEADPIPTREGALPHAQEPPAPDPLETPKPQVSPRDLEISSRDLAPEPDTGKELHLYPADEAWKSRLIAHARTAIGDARGAHLKDVLAVAKAAGDCTGWTVTTLREELTVFGIRIEDKLWLRGRGGNTRGVLATSLPPLPEPTPEHAQESP